MGETAGGVLRRGSDRIVAGVCSGLAHYFHIDTIVVRFVFVILALLHGVGILIYLVLWFLMDPPSGPTTEGSRNVGDRLRTMGDEIREDFRTGFRRSDATPGQPAATSTTPGPVEPRSTPPPVYGRPRAFWLGVILIVAGGYFLLDNLGFLNAFRWDIFWPVFLIAIGLFVLLRRR